MVALEETPINEIGSPTGTVEPTGDKKMTYNEWRQIRRRRKLLYKAPVCMTGLESLMAQPGYSIKLSVEITGFPAPSVTWFLNNEVLENDRRFSIESDVTEGIFSLIISQITSREAGCYKCFAENCEGADNTMAFIKVKDESRRRRKRSVSQRPHISTIKEWKSREEAEKVDLDPKEERLLLRNRQCWDWWNLNAASDDERRGDREPSCDLLEGAQRSDSKTEKEWESVSGHKKYTRTRSRSLPPRPKSPAPVVQENKMKKLKLFWESNRHR